MTVAALTQTRAQIAGDGVTDRVDVTFQFVDETDLKVIHTDSGGTDTEWIFQESPGDWFFSGGDYAAGTIHFTASDLAVGERLTVLLTSQYDQALSLDGGEIDPSVLERGLDRAALQIQAMAGDVSRSLRVAASTEGDPIDLEVPDLPEGYGFVREGNALVPAVIDSAAITTAKNAALQAQADAQTAQGEAESARDTAVTAASSASSSATDAGTSASAASGSASAASGSASDAAQSASDAVTNATAVLGYGRIPVGAMMPWAGPKAPNQFWVLITEPNQRFARATYPGALDVLAPEYDVTNTSGSAVVSGFDTSLLGSGTPVEGTGIPSNTTIVSVDSATQVTLSQATTASVASMRVFPHGNGDGATTANWPNAAGRVFRGIDTTDVVNPSGSRLGETEEDAFQDHQHGQNAADVGSSIEKSGTTENTGLPMTEPISHYISQNNVSSPTRTHQVVTDGAAPELGARVSDETRVKAWIGPYIIKVADGVDDEATITAVQVVQNATDALSKALANEAEVAKFGSVAVLQYQLPNGTNGGAATAGSRQTYPLNTEVYDPNGIISLASFRFTTAVAVEVEFWATFYNTAQTKLYLRNITDGVDVADSGKAYVRAGTFSTGHVAGRALLETGKTYELQYEVATTKSSNGLGVGAGSPSGVEVYGQLSARAI